MTGFTVQMLLLTALCCSRVLDSLQLRPVLKLNGCQTNSARSHDFRRRHIYIQMKLNDKDTDRSSSIPTWRTGSAAIFAATLLFPMMVNANYLMPSAASSETILQRMPVQIEEALEKYTRSTTQANIPLDVTNILRDRFTVLRADVTGEKVGQLRVGDSLVNRLRAVDTELDNIQEDIFKEPADWDVIAVYPKVLRAYSTLFTAYTDRAFPSDTAVDKALRYALRYEVGAFYGGVQEFEQALAKKSARQAQRSFARMSLAYDHYLKAGDLYLEYDEVDYENTEAAYRNPVYAELAKTKLNYVAPSLEAPGLQDEIILLKGPDKGRKGTVLWISKGGETLQSASVVIKLEAKGVGKHREVNSYPYSLVAKTTPPEVQFVDALCAAYIASAVSSGIMFPVDTYKTRIQSGKRGIPQAVEGGIFRLWSGVQFFILDANDAVYVAAYGLIKPALLSPIDTTNVIAVFAVLTLAGALGDAVGSVFRVPCEIVCKQVQTGRLTSAQGSILLWETIRDAVAGNSAKTADGSVGASVRRVVALSWIAVLCRDMPFAGLQIAFFDVYRSLFSFLDEAGWSTFSQRAVWGAFAGATAGFLTTPFDLLTTQVMLAAESAEKRIETVKADLDYNLKRPRVAAATTEERDRDRENSVGRRRVMALSAQSISPSQTEIEMDAFSDSMADIEEQLELFSKSTYFPTPIAPGEKKMNKGLATEVFTLFVQTFKDLLTRGGLGALFTGAVPRLLFFAPASMIFFATYETFFDLITAARIPS